ncbi:topoisomerase DNA-binding C4 zinc finger domain-containing protein [Clostridium estertheticum]|uniref:topoisomerase DNA-binding C4 zinc finger domain-containing protein n=1 Tax=Clostridium estertheticum TaxID=238834 RepID=UPI001C0B3B83|nr:topoisomerase DNA-binding C4 zinc finger domain-containing protein [Clostridium estertheticum]MBU3183247.1 topoisomerase DNA-binding C4 zinc finger domain-containing protein [Clostridium estertheticum]
MYRTLAEKNIKVNSGICTKCGGKLVLRNGKYGQFKGCSNYLKCRFNCKIK